MVYEWKGDPTTEAALVEAGTLVPVERCEHGNIDPHWCPYSEYSDPGMRRCQGARIGDNK